MCVWLVGLLVGVLYMGGSWLMAYLTLTLCFHIMYSECAFYYLLHLDICWFTKFNYNSYLTTHFRIFSPHIHTFISIYTFIFCIYIYVMYVCFSIYCTYI